MNPEVMLSKLKFTMNTFPRLEDESLLGCVELFLWGLPDTITPPTHLMCPMSKTTGRRTIELGWTKEVRDAEFEVFLTFSGDVVEWCVSTHGYGGRGASVGDYKLIQFFLETWFKCEKTYNEAIQEFYAVKQ